MAEQHGDISEVGHDCLLLSFVVTSEAGRAMLGKMIVAHDMSKSINVMSGDYFVVSLEPGGFDGVYHVLLSPKDLQLVHPSRGNPCELKATA